MARVMENFVNPLQHYASEFGGKELFWYSTDTQDLYNQHLQNPTTLNSLKENNWIDKTICYRFNSHGFRTDEFIKKRNFITLGCSFTQGTGLCEEQIWPAMISKQLNIDVWNLGVAGASNDTCYRIANYYIPLLRPEFVVMLAPDIHRMEVFSAAPQPQPINFANTFKDLNWKKQNWRVKQWVTNKRNLEIYSEKTAKAIAYVCGQLGIDFYYYQDAWFKNTCWWTNNNGYNSRARDLQHPGEEINSNLARIICQDIHNKNTYASKSV
jgi:hypothetical protein